MTDSHLLNTIRFLRRRSPSLLACETNAAWSCLASLQGEMAQYYCERDIDVLEETDPDDWLEQNSPEFQEMQKELSKRHLTELPV